MTDFFVAPVCNRCVIPRLRSLQFSRPARGLSPFPVAMAWGKHLFPFRTEQLSPTAPMVLGSQGPGRVGRRRFNLTSGAVPQGRPLTSGAVLPRRPFFVSTRPAGRRRAAPPGLRVRLAWQGGAAGLGPGHPATGPARAREGTQRRAVRVLGHATTGRARSGGLAVLQQEKGAREGDGAPQGGVNGDGARAAPGGRGEHAFVSLRCRSDGTHVRARDLAAPWRARQVGSPGLGFWRLRA